MECANSRCRAPRPCGILIPVLMGLCGLLAMPCGSRAQVKAPSPSPSLIPTEFRLTSAELPLQIHEAQAFDRFALAHREAKRLEKAGSPACVDRYYEAVVFAYAAMSANGGITNRTGWDRAQCGYNTSLTDCLRTAVVFKRLHPRSHLEVQGPAGPMVIPITYRGFVWARDDFEGLIDPLSIPKNPAQHRSHQRPGLGSPQVAARTNPMLSPSDRFLPPHSYFPVTAILRPDLPLWLGLPTTSSSSSQTGDILEFHDPLRATHVEWPNTLVPLASNLDAPIAMAAASGETKRYTLEGLLNPSTEVKNAFLGFLEPYQPNRIPVVFVHGLNANPYTFTDLINGLRSSPAFLNQYQIVVFRYPTGLTFIRSAAIFRRNLREMESTFDPQRRDPGLQNSVLIGHSMGGLINKLQITWSGTAIWDLASTRPLDSLVASETTKSRLREIFFFEPLPFVRRTIFIGTPHDGAALAKRAVGRVTSRLIRRASDSLQLVEQLDRDNPGAVRPYMANLPSSVDMLAKRGPILETMRQLSINPATTYHTIAGTNGLPPRLAIGDGVVPLTSAHSDGAASEVWVPSSHTKLNANPATLVEVQRILQEHLVASYGDPVSPLPLSLEPIANSTP